jgi:hypothetical protein
LRRGYGTYGCRRFPYVVCLGHTIRPLECDDKKIGRTSAVSHSVSGMSGEMQRRQACGAPLFSLRTGGCIRGSLVLATVNWWCPGALLSFAHPAEGGCRESRLKLHANRLRDNKSFAADLVGSPAEDVEPTQAIAERPVLLGGCRTNRCGDRRPLEIFRHTSEHLLALSAGIRGPRLFLHTD